jgi:hypothetical protein
VNPSVLGVIILAFVEGKGEKAIFGILDGENRGAVRLLLLLAVDRVATQQRDDCWDPNAE